MKKIISLIVIFVCTWSSANAQEEEPKLDILKAPSSPASNLLGIAPSDVDKPTDVSAFMLSLQKATSNFSFLPSNFAFDIAPYWLGNKKPGDITTDGMRNSKGKGVFGQTLVLSFGIRNTDSTETELVPNTLYGGLGFKFSIVRGKYDTVTIQKLNSIHIWQAFILKAKVKVLEEQANDIKLEELNNERDILLRKKFSRNISDDEKQRVLDRLNDIDDTTSKILLERSLQQDNAGAELSKARNEIKQLASSFQTARVGWTWDVSGGISAGFFDKRFDKSKVNNAGLWTTFGYTDDTTARYYGSGLVLARVLYNPDKIFAKDNAPIQQKDVWTFDAGLRYIYSRPQSKFSASLEGIYRSVLTTNTIKPSWKLVFNADYALWANQKLTFSFGRNFDGTITKGGNLIAGLSFLTGFGNTR